VAPLTPPTHTLLAGCPCAQRGDKNGGAVHSSRELSHEHHYHTFQHTRLTRVVHTTHTQQSNLTRTILCC